MTAKVVDLDAARAARAEASGVGPTVRFAGNEFTLPVELPFAIAEASSGEIADLRAGLEALLGDAYPVWESCSPSLQDIQALFESLPGVYGLGDLPN